MQPCTATISDDHGHVQCVFDDGHQGDHGAGFLRWDSDGDWYAVHAVAPPMASVYRERAHLLAHLAAVYPSHFQPDPGEPDWPVLFISLPTGQACWHIAPDDLDLFPHVADGGDTWDGHTTEVKYQRVDHATRIKAAGCWVA